MKPQKAPALFQRILYPLAAAAGLAMAATAAYAADPVAVEAGLEAAYFANDLPADLPAGSEIAQWPESKVRVGPLATAGNRPPTLMDEGFVGAKTKAVMFDAIPPGDQGGDPKEYQKNMNYLNFPPIQEPGQKWEEITIVMAGTGLDKAGVFDMNPGATPTFRNYGWIQFTDKTCGAGIGNPVPPEYINMPIVQAVTISRTPSSNSVLKTYVNGTETASKEQELRDGAQGPMVPFEGVVIAGPRNLFPIEAGSTDETALARGANIGAGPNNSGRKEQIAVAAVLLYSRALTPEEVKKVSEDLMNRLGM